MPVRPVDSCRSAFIAGWLAVAVAPACTESRKAIEVVRVEPDRIDQGTATAVTALGRHFFDRVGARLDDQSPPRFERGWQAWLGDRPVDISRLDDEHLRLVAPADLPVGRHSLTVVSPWDHRGELADALQVVAGGMLGAEVDAGPGADARSGPAAGPTWNRFSSPLRLTAVGMNDDARDPSITDDLLEVYFSSQRTGNDDLWVAKRAAATSSWGDVQPVVELNTTGYEADPEVSGDGLTLWFASNQGPDLQLWVTTRPDRQSQWSAPTQIDALNSPQADSGPSVISSGLTLVLHSQRNQNQADIYLSDRPATGVAWSTPRSLGELNTPSFDGSPYLRNDQFVIVFESSRPGTAGGRDLYWASRNALDQPFAAIAAIGELNSGGIDGDPEFSPDMNYVIFASDRSGIEQLYEAFR
jgi:hypothetical protein